MWRTQVCDDRGRCLVLRKKVSADARAPHVVSSHDPTCSAFSPTVTPGLEGLTLMTTKDLQSVKSYQPVQHGRVLYGCQSLLIVRAAAFFPDSEAS